MNLIDIGIYFLVFLTGVAFLWFLARFKLIKDIKDKESKAQSIISSAKNKANRLIKDTEKKVKNFKDSHTKKIKTEVERMEKDIELRKTELVNREKTI